MRKSELVCARWEEFDLDGQTHQGSVWCLPANRTKMGEALSIPLVPEVVEWLRALQQCSDGSGFVFPVRRRNSSRRYGHLGVCTLNAVLAPVPHGLAPFTLHDLRRTARTHLAALGIRREVAERCLGHKLPGVEGIYDRHDYLKERRAALTQWTEVLLQAERGTSNVVAFRRATEPAMPDSTTAAGAWSTMP